MYELLIYIQCGNHLKKKKKNNISLYAFILRIFSEL